MDDNRGLDSSVGKLADPESSKLSTSKTPQPRSIKDMSESLRSRLKRCSRYSVSPLAPKRPIKPLQLTQLNVTHTSNFQDPSTEQSLMSHAPLSPTEVDRKSSIDDDTVRLSPKQCATTKLSSTRDVNKCKDASSEVPSTFVTESMSVEDLQKFKAELVQKIAEKEEDVRKLNLVKTHREKNDIATLTSLTAKWRTVVQRSLIELWNSAAEPKPSLTEIIDCFQLDHKMIGYHADDESFS